jgi:peptidoglycan/LPS O-acetylase OafA/YrhL
MSINLIPTSPYYITHNKYRKDIDGLRAIAVLSVVLFHAFPQLLRGGFVGVDVFFVISGFLISSIIFEQLERGSFSFIDFYSRRIKRIFPALLLVLSACLGFGWFSLLTDEYKQLGKHVAGGAGFVSNVLLWHESGYFDNNAYTKPLLHLWSLGIEEQFYIVWPVILWLAWKKRFNLLTITVIVLVSSFILNLAKVNSNSVATFYLLPTRGWELLIGAVFAHWTLYPVKPDSWFAVRVCKLDGWLKRLIYSPAAAAAPAAGATLRDVMSVLGMVLLVMSFVAIYKERSFPGWWALLPTLGSVLIIAAGAQAWLNRTVLANKIMVWLGLISFPLYLWHWPLLSFARIIENATPSRWVRLAALAIAFVLAWLTYRFVEKPIRFGAQRRVVVIALVGLMLLVGAVGAVVYKLDGMEQRNPHLNEVVKPSGEWQYPGDMKKFDFKGSTFYYKNSSLKTATLFIGDSNIAQYYVRADELIKTKPDTTNSMVFSTGGTCAPIKHVHISNYKHCVTLLQDSLDYAISSKNITTVVIGGYWVQYLSNEANSYFKNNDDDKEFIQKENNAYKKAFIELDKYIKILKSADKNVILILQIPTGDELDPRDSVKRTLGDFPHMLKRRNKFVSVGELDEKYGHIKNSIIEVAKSNAIEFIDPMNYLCNSISCPSFDQDESPIYKDAAHLSPYFVRKNATFIDKTIAVP